MNDSVKHKSAVTFFNGDDFVLCEIQTELYILFILTESFKGANCVTQQPQFNHGTKIAFIWRELRKA
jgi:hypothetical protein